MAISKGEVLEVLALYARQLGPKGVKALVISDDWGDGRTTMVLLLQNPNNPHYQGLLDDEGTRERVNQTVLAFQESLASA